MVGALLGHNMKQGCLLLSVLEGKIQGKRKRGHPRNYIIQACKDIGSADATLKRVAEKRGGWRDMIRQLQNQTSD